MKIVFALASMSLVSTSKAESKGTLRNLKKTPADTTFVDAAIMETYEGMCTHGTASVPASANFVTPQSPWGEYDETNIEDHLDELCGGVTGSDCKGLDDYTCAMTLGCSWNSNAGKCNGPGGANKPKWEGRDITCDGERPVFDEYGNHLLDEEGNPIFEPYTGYFICHNPNTSHTFPRTHCQDPEQIPPRMRPQSFASCGWCCQTDDEETEDNKWEADECGDDAPENFTCDSDDDGVNDGYMLLMTNGSNQGRLKESENCITYEDIQDNLNQHWGSECA